MRHKPKPFDEPGLSRLERLRRFHRLTWRDMEERTGVPRSSMGRIMNGYFPDVRVAIRVAKMFDVTVEDIWGEEAMK